MSAGALPIIDIAPLRAEGGNPVAAQESVAQMADACRAHGFFYVRGHGVDPALVQRLEDLSHRFFALPTHDKLQWRMALSGRAWRGFFPLAGELTSGRPDWKEGIYFGAELPPDDARVLAGTPLHGPNQFPDAVVPGLRDAVLAYMEQVTRAAHAVLRGIALSLGLEAAYFADRYTHDPLVLFRIFNYPSQPLPHDLAGAADSIWGVGEHTDYGLLTLLHQDTVGGLQVRTPQGWVEAPPVAGTLVCNIGDMLDRMTGGLYKSTLHRVVRNASGRDRLSFPLFFDPNFFARVQRIEGLLHAQPVVDDSATRWDQANVHAFQGSYGDYLLNKVSKVFPQLTDEVLA